MPTQSLDPFPHAHQTQVAGSQRCCRRYLPVESVPVITHYNIELPIVQAQLDLGIVRLALSEDIARFRDHNHILVLCEVARTQLGSKMTRKVPVSPIVATECT